MKYWDSSALVPLLVQEADTRKREKQLREDPQILTWWGSKVECASALNRLGREGALLGSVSLEQALNDLDMLSRSWTEIHASEKVQRRALRLLRVHPLRAADSLHLAAVLVAVDEQPAGFPFVCADERLADAASKEGFSVVE